MSIVASLYIDGIAITIDVPFDDILDELDTIVVVPLFEIHPVEVVRFLTESELKSDGFVLFDHPRKYLYAPVTDAFAALVGVPERALAAPVTDF